MLYPANNYHLFYILIDSSQSLQLACVLPWEISNKLYTTDFLESVIITTSHFECSKAIDILGRWYRSFTKNIKDLAYTIDGERITTTKSYCYLGIEMSSTGSFYKATDALYNKSLRAM